MAHPEDVSVGREALDGKLITKDQLVEALFALSASRRAQVRRAASASLADTLLRLGFVSRADLGWLATLSMDRTLARLALRQKLVTKSQVAGCRRAQRDARRARRPVPRLADLLSERGYLSMSQVKQLIAGSAASTEYQCTACGLRFAVAGGETGLRTPCIRCGETLEPALRSFLEESPASRAVAAWACQMNIVDPDALQDAQQLQREFGEYGVEMGLGAILRRCGRLSSSEFVALEKRRLPSLVRTKEWTEQAVPGYRIVAKIEQGGHGALFAAEAFFTRKRVALKLLFRELASNAAAVARFHQEARLLTRFDHPNIVKAIEHGIHRGLHFMAMEFVEGTRLDWAVLSQKGFSPRVAIFLIRQVIEALRYMGKQGYLHRDVKPGNILLDRRDRALLIDLGLACEIQLRSDIPSDVTEGTAEYMSPEQARGERLITVASEVYSLGLVLYFMLAGRHPFEGATSEEVMERRFAHGVATPDVDGLDIPAALAAVVRRMIQPQAARRYATYENLLSALDALAL